MIMMEVWNLLWELGFKRDEVGADKKEVPFLLLVVVCAGNEPPRRKLFPHLLIHFLPLSSIHNESC